MYIVKKIDKREWAQYSEMAHLSVFRQVKSPDDERIDFALLIVDENSFLHGYATCKELDANTLYLQYGGGFPDTIGKGEMKYLVGAIVDWAKENKYHRISTYVENSNYKMLRTYMRVGFLITGIRNFKSRILLENSLEFYK